MCYGKEWNPDPTKLPLIPYIKALQEKTIWDSISAKKSGNSDSA